MIYPNSHVIFLLDRTYYLEEVCYGRQQFPISSKIYFPKTAFAHLATLMPDGSPQVTPVWCDFDGSQRAGQLGQGPCQRQEHATRQESRAFGAGPRQTHTVISPCSGEIGEITEEGADAHIDSLAKKYLGKDKYPFRQPGEVRVIYKIRPVNVHTWGKSWDRSIRYDRLRFRLPDGDLLLNCCVSFRV